MAKRPCLPRSLTGHRREPADSVLPRYYPKSGKTIAYMGIKGLLPG
jgi:hypothetical protein